MIDMPGWDRRNHPLNRLQPAEPEPWWARNMGKIMLVFILALGCAVVYVGAHFLMKVW